MIKSHAMVNLTVMPMYMRLFGGFLITACQGKLNGCLHAYFFQHSIIFEYQDFVNKESLYFGTGSVEDYTMLEKMNKVTASKYTEVKNLVTGVNHSMNDLNTKCELSAGVQS